MSQQARATNGNKQSKKNQHQQQQQRLQEKQSFNDKGGIQSRYSREGNRYPKKSTPKRDSKTVLVSGIAFDD